MSPEQIPPLTPWQRFTQLMAEDRQDLAILLLYTLLNGLLMLAVPLASQALVNTIAAGIFLQPLVVLSFLLLAGMVFAGALRVMQLVLVEVIQQRVFTKVALRLAYRLPRIELRQLRQEYAPELANRFFDILTVQKTWSKLLLEGPSALLQIAVGLILLAFYSPLLLAFDLLLVLGILIIFWGLSFGGLSSSIRESYQKYNMAGWLEELGRCHISFKIAGLPDYTLEQANQIASQYIQARGQHFRVLFRQATGTYLLYAMASAGILAIGGWLVINRQLTLGQLVAAEIVVFSVLGALEKLMYQIGPFYDLLTGMDKIGHVTDMPLERAKGSPVPNILQDNMLQDNMPQGMQVSCKGLRFIYPASGFSESALLSGIDMEIEPGSRISLAGTSGSGKSTIASLLCGLQEPTHGVIEINGVDIRDLDLRDLRRWVAWAGMTHEVFEGTIEENITLGRSWVSQHDIRWALDATRLTEDLARMPQGKQAPLVSEGRNLSLGQRQRLMIARAIVDRPRLLILDEVLSAIDLETQHHIVDFLLDKSLPWTVIFITQLPQVIVRTDQVFVLHQGKMVESGPPRALLSQSQSMLKHLYLFEKIR